MAMFSLANAAGAAFRAALNTVLGKLHRNYYGSTDPSAAAESTPGMLWVDTNGGTPVLKARNASDTGWITLGALDPSAFQLAGTSVFGRSLIDDADSTAAHGTLGTLAFLGNKVPTGATDLGDATDLNTVINPGFYWQNRDADAAAGSNYPIARGGALVVLKHGTLNGTTGEGMAQIYVSRYVSTDGRARAFFRSEFDNTWSPWAEIAAVGGISTGAMTFIASVDLANDATAEFTGFDDTLYDEYVFVLANVIPSSDNASLWLRTSANGGTSYDSSGYRYIQYGAGTPDTTLSTFGSTSSTNLLIAGNSVRGVGSDTNEYGVSGRVTIPGPHLSAYTRVLANITFVNPTSILHSSTTSGERMSTSAVNAVRFLFSEGNLESGTITMYGVKNA